MIIIMMIMIMITTAEQGGYAIWSEEEYFTKSTQLLEINVALGLRHLIKNNFENLMILNNYLLGIFVSVISISGVLVELNIKNISDPGSEVDKAGNTITGYISVNLSNLNGPRLGRRRAGGKEREAWAATAEKGKQDLRVSILPSQADSACFAQTPRPLNNSSGRQGRPALPNATSPPWKTLCSMGVHGHNPFSWYQLGFATFPY